MGSLGSDHAALGLTQRPRTLLIDEDTVFLWPGIPLTEKRDGFVVPMPQGWIRYWTGRLHGTHVQDAALISALAKASKYLSWGFQASAQSALDATKLGVVSPDGAQLMRVIAARLGVAAPNMPVAIQALYWGIGSPGDLALYDLFADEALKLEKAWNPQQPRWPKHAPDSQGGRFSPSGSGAGAPSAAANTQPPPQEPGSTGIGHNGGPPLDEPPEIPPEEPLTSQIRTAIIKDIARWLLRRGVTALMPGVGEALVIVQLGAWLYQYLPYIDALLDKPQTLDELQDAVAQPKNGYEVHHIAEQTAARNDGFPNSQINSPENTVRIPTLKHWEITAWYMKGSEDFGGLSPREYLRGKDWAERTRVGLIALRKFGVLKQ